MNEMDEGDEFICPVTKNEVTTTHCESSAEDTGCSFKNQCEAYKEQKKKEMGWENLTEKDG